MLLLGIILMLLGADNARKSLNMFRKTDIAKLSPEELVTLGLIVLPAVLIFLLGMILVEFPRR